MKFLITRTSNMFDREPKAPCPETQKEVYQTNMMDRMGKTYVRDESGWFRDFNSLEELDAFMVEVDQPLIFQRNMFNKEIHEIEIYDDYRE